MDVELRSSFCHLDMNSSSEAWFANIFSPCVNCLSPYWWFPWLHRSFEFSVIALVYFCFCGLCVSCHIQEIITKSRVVKISPVVSSSNFIVSSLLLSSLIHLELIFVRNEKYGSRFTLLPGEIGFPQPVCWNNCPLPHCIRWFNQMILLKIVWPSTQGWSLASLFFPVCLYVCLSAVTTLFVSLAFIFGGMLSKMLPLFLELYWFLMYLAVPGLNCRPWGLRSSLQRAASLFAACKCLVVACGI